MDQPYQPAPGAPAGWYPLPGGGQRYWDGNEWTGNPVPPKRQQQPRDSGLVTMALALSLILTPLVGLVMGLARISKNRTDAAVMLVGSLIIFVIYAVAINYVT